jgi:hypothetical protein
MAKIEDDGGDQRRVHLVEFVLRLDGGGHGRSSERRDGIDENIVLSLGQHVSFKRQVGQPWRLPRPTSWPAKRGRTWQRRNWPGRSFHKGPGKQVSGEHEEVEGSERRHSKSALHSATASY